MLIPSPVETKGGNWLPRIKHTERKYFADECFPRKLKRTKDDAVAYAERVIVDRETAK